MNKKGFTLVELLVTISIIISLTAIVIVGVVSISNRSKEQAYEEVKEQIMTAAEQYFDANEYMFEGLGEGAYGVITVGMLVQEDYLNRVVDPRDGTPVHSCTQVQVKKENGRYVTTFMEYDEEGGYTCSNENFVALSEPGAPSIEANFYNRDTNETNISPNEDGWFNVDILGNGGTIGVNVNLLTMGNGEIESLTSCTSTSSNCTNFNDNYLINQVTSESNISYKDETTYQNDIRKTHVCYEVTNISGKSARTCVYAGVDTTAPNCSTNIVGGTIGNYVEGTQWYKGNTQPKITYTGADTLSGVAGIYKNSSNELITNNSEYTETISSEKNYVSVVMDNAGNTSSCGGKYGYDNTKPSCNVSLSYDKKGNNAVGYQWYTGDWVKLTGTCSDGISGCVTNSTSKTYKEEGKYNIGSADAGTVYDNAGNSNNCIYSTAFGIDRTPPVIDLNNVRIGRDPETSPQNRIILNITDNVSGFYSAPFAYCHSGDRGCDTEDNNYNQLTGPNTNDYWHGFAYSSVTSNTVTITSITVYDNAGNQKNYSDISCSYSLLPSTWNISDPIKTCTQ